MANRMGRPNSLTPQLQEEILQYLRSGASYAGACKHVGISRATFFAWKALGREHREHKEVVPERVIYVQFIDAIERVDAAVEMDLVGEVRTAKGGQGADAWQSRAWLLERSGRFRQEYGRDAGLLEEMMAKLVHLEDKIAKLNDNEGGSHEKS